MASKPSKKYSAQDVLRRQVKREWRGFDDALDLNAGIHLPSEFIAEIIRSAGLAEGMEEEKLRSLWADLAGPYVAKASQPQSLKRGVLTIRVTQPAMRFHLEQMRGSLLTKIQQAAGNDKIQSIRFSVG
jgi:hypothetical protein